MAKVNVTIGIWIGFLPCLQGTSYSCCHRSRFFTKKKMKAQFTAQRKRVGHCGTKTGGNFHPSRCRQVRNKWNNVESLPCKIKKKPF